MRSTPRMRSPVGQRSLRKGEHDGFSFGSTGFDVVWGHPGRIVWTIWPDGSRAPERDLTGDTNGGFISVVGSGYYGKGAIT